jgi:rsbT co-antagonist protein RsbR
MTGVPDLSAEAAEVLLRAVDAAQLLGTQLVLVGVQPRVAQILGDLDFDLSGLIVLSNLQAGLAHAIGSLASMPVSSPSLE